jgi:two-component sensor histidine kinase
LDALPAATRPQLSTLDGPLSRIHRDVFLDHSCASVAVASCLYVAIVLIFGKGLAISSNYFVILPVLVASLSFELPGGAITGILALPANLLLFAVMGHPEFSPASKPIAELAGIVVGTAFGSLANYFSKLEAEIRRRIATEEALRRVLAEKEALLKEVQHRVRNNLNITKSLVQLQKNRSADPVFLAAADDLLLRFHAMALVQEQFYGSEGAVSIGLESYLSSLVSDITSVLNRGPAPIAVERYFAEAGDIGISPDLATPLGLIVNEALTNCLRHAFPGAAIAAPRIVIALAPPKGDRFLLAIEDNGVGIAKTPSRGLGLTMIHALAAQMNGEAKLGPRRGPGGSTLCGTRFELLFPRP